MAGTPPRLPAPKYLNIVPLPKVSSTRAYMMIPISACKPAKAWAFLLWLVGMKRLGCSFLKDSSIYIEQALTLFQQLNDSAGKARVLQAIGDVQQLSRQPDAALQSYQEALALFQQIQNQAEQAKLLEMIGDIYHSLGEHESALHNYQQALKLYQDEKDHLKRAKVLKTIGDIQRLTDKDAALESYGQALALFSELKEPTEEANIQQAIYEIQQSESESAKVSESNQQAVLNGPSGSITLGNTSINIGRLPTNQLVVNDPKISARHATIRPTASGHTISDLGSSNGTFLNERRLTPQVEVGLGFV